MNTSDFDMSDFLSSLNDDTDFNSPPTAMSDVKRTRLSPRTKALDEVASLITDYLATVEEEETVEVLTKLKDTVLSLKIDADTVVVGWKHYVGLNADGSRSRFKSQQTPVRTSDCKFVCVVGPFSFKAGADYVVKNGVRPSDKVVFGVCPSSAVAAARVLEEESAATM